MNVKVTVDKAKLEELLQSAPERIKRGVRSGLHAFLFDLVNYISTDKLQGQVLKWRTGNLARTVIASPTIEETPTGFIGKFGSNAVYAAIHEFGGVIHPRTAKHLRFKAATGWVTTDEVIMPERSYLRSSLQEEAPNFPETMKEQIVRALEANA